MSTPPPATRRDPDSRPGSLEGSGAGTSSLPRLVAGRYLLEQVLAQGGMGVVYRALDQRLQRAVAVKQMRTHGDPEERARFVREARTAAGLQHPNVVAVHDCGLDEGGPFLVMDLIEGASLEDHVQDGGVLDPREAASITLALAEALSAAHAQGVLHRDLKPGNVLLLNGTPLLTDFGLAQRREDPRITVSGTVVGTPAYMAPEQAHGLDLDHRTDVYGLGACLYRILTGSPPHWGATIASTLLNVVEHDPEPIATRRADVDPALAAICHRCLQRDPADRYLTAAALADDLRRWLAGDPLDVPAPTNPPRRRLAIRLVLTALCLAGLGLTVITVRRADRARESLSTQEATPDTAEAHLQRGLVHYGAKRWEAAERVFTAGLEHARDDAQRARLLERRGDARGERGAYALQAKDYDEALALVPDQVSTLHKRGVARWRLKRADDALQDFDRALLLDPTQANTWYERGYVKRLTKRPGFRADLERAVELAPDRVMYLRSVGVARFETGDRKGAVEALDLAVANGGDPFDAHLHRALLKAQLKDLRGALADMSEALRHKPTHPRALLERAKLLILLKQFERAEADATRLLAITPRDARAWGTRGQARLRRKRPALAIQDLDRALRLSPRYIEAINWRAAAKEQQRDYLGAMVDYRHLGQVLGPERKHEQAQIRAKLEQLERLRAAAPR